MPSLRYTCFPYCLAQLPCGGYAVLNRAYKPLGFHTDAWVHYKEYPIVYDIAGLGPELARRLSWNGSDDLKMIHLYNDTTTPVDPPSIQQYLERLALLLPRLTQRGESHAALRHH